MTSFEDRLQQVRDARATHRPPPVDERDQLDVANRHLAAGRRHRQGPVHHHGCLT